MKLSKCPGCMEDFSHYPCPNCSYDPSSAKNTEYALSPETILAGKYLVGKVLGQGGFGITYIGWDIALERKVAIKEYYPSGQVSRRPGSLGLTWYTTEQAVTARQSGMQMFLKEARKMVKVDSIPGVVRVLDLFQENGTAYIVMEFVEGITLKEHLQRVGPLSWNETKRIFLPVIRSMEQVHSSGLIHRDLSPDNLMLAPDGSVKILDLGAAKDLSLNSGVSSMQVAKSGFSPLEQYIQRGGSGPWTDVYSIAATIYYTLTGVLPPSAVERLEQDTISWSEPALKALPGSALAALQKAMAVQINDRTPNLEALEKGLFEAPSPASASVEKAQKKSSPSPAPDKPKSRQKKPWLPIMASLAVCAVCFAFVRGIASTNKKVPAETQQAAQDTAETQISLSTTTPTTPPAAGHRNQMREDVCSYDWQESNQRYATQPVFGSSYTRDQICEIKFLDSILNAGSDAWDISADSDGSVLAWTMPKGGKYVLYIGAAGKVYAPENCWNLFALYENLVSIDFGGVFDTSKVTDMTYMFSLCANLETIDLSSFDTAKVQSVAGMFSDCASMKSLDLRNFNFDSSINTKLIFENCTSLTRVQANNLHIKPVDVYQDGSTQELDYATVSPFILTSPLVQCRQITVKLDVEMNAGTRCPEWDLWGSSGGEFKKIAKFTLPDGTGSAEQTITFDSPVDLTALVPTPTRAGNYSWSLDLTVPDALVGVS